MRPGNGVSLPPCHTPPGSRASSCIQASAFALRKAVLCKGWMLNGWQGRWGMWRNTEHLRKAGSQGWQFHGRQAARFSSGDSTGVARVGQPALGEGASPVGEGAGPVGEGSRPYEQGGSWLRGGQHPVRVVSGRQDISTPVETSPSEPRGPEVPGDLGMALPLSIPREVCSSPYFKSQNK